MYIMYVHCLIIFAAMFHQNLYYFGYASDLIKNPLQSFLDQQCCQIFPSSSSAELCNQDVIVYMLSHVTWDCQTCLLSIK
jgi:hypothetical protein